MTKQILEVRQYTGVNNVKHNVSPYFIYTVRDDDKYILCNDGSVFFTDKEHCQDMIRDGEKLEVPHSNSKCLEVFEVDGIIGVYDWNMNCLNTYKNLDEFVEAYSEDQDRFENFDFPTDEYNKYYYDDDCSGDDGFRDCAPNYYDPRYDGPFNYIPPGEH